MNFIQFKSYGLDNKLADQSGSDGIFILDGRNNIDTMVEDAYDRIHVLRKVQPHFKFFEVRKGSILDSIVLFRNYTDEDMVRKI